MPQDSNLLQSDGWERFQQALGRKTERIAGVLAIEMPLPFGKKYLYSPRSSSVRHPEEASPTRDLAIEDAQCAQAAGVVFWRSELKSKLSTLNYQILIPRVLRRAVEPEWTWRTSLVGSDDELLGRMHEKHRYNIGLARRRGVVVRVADSPTSPPLRRGSEGPARLRGASRQPTAAGDTEAFWALVQETAKRQDIATHPKTYYETMLRALPNTTLYLAERDGVPVATSIVAYHGDTATYLHGGSSYEHRALMAPHLLHWQAMRDARDAEMRWYDFGGIQPEVTSDKWIGLTRFKQGFGGETVRHPPTRDLVVRPNWYRVFSWITQLRP